MSRFVAEEMPQRWHKNNHRKYTNSKITANFVTQMSKVAFTFLILGLCLGLANAAEEKTVKSLPSQAASPSSTLSSNIVPRTDEIYIDDEAIEGSGGRGELHDDLEKDTDYSGSGFGPDDEDSSTDHRTQLGKTDDQDLYSKTHQTSDTSGGTSIDDRFGIFTGDRNTGTSSGNSDKASGTVNGGSGVNTIAGINNQGTIELDSNNNNNNNNNINSLPPDTKVTEHTTGNEVLIMNAGDDDRTTSFFAQPGILAAVIGGAVVGLLCAILVVMFIVYRMRKKDEGSYALDEPKRSPAVNSYAKNANNREFYA